VKLPETRLPELYIGLMSGTSLDGVDGVLVDLSSTGVKVLANACTTFDESYRQELLALNTPGSNELHRAALAANTLATHYAVVVADLLAQAQTKGITGENVTAIGAHGQTVRHRPQEFGVGYTLQLNNPALLAELTGIDVIADFRNADVAAGGQGAPLVPVFHSALWGAGRRSRAVLNIGGISNLTLLPGLALAETEATDVSNATVARPILGFDCGPGNALMDFWCQRHTGQAFDDAGAWAASGQVDGALLTRLLATPYLAQQPPKSTGRDLFNPGWLLHILEGFAELSPVNVQATLTAFSATACAHDLRRHLPDAGQLLVCGGGALNETLMSHLREALPGVLVESTQAHGLPPLQVEASAFAWLARAFVRRQAGNLVAVTGARGPRVLGALYPGHRS
jgi:anhydro-N-acetylmuramic acid kinase